MEVLKMEVFVELITTVGFPIACVIAMGLFIYNIYKKSEDREDKLMYEIQKTREVNAQAIETIAHYAEKLDTIQEDIKDIKQEVTILAAAKEN